MNSQKLNDWLQLVGMAGVIASLIFVGLQLRQTQQIAMSNAYQARAYASVDTNMAIIMAPVMLSAEAKLWSGKDDDLTPEELLALAHDFYGKMDIYENNQYQFVLGFLSEEHWQKNLRTLNCLFSLPLYRELWEPHEFRQSYADLIDSIIREARANPSDCWSYEKGSVWDW